MRKIPFVILIILLFFTAFQCGNKKKPTPPDTTNPKYYFPINLTYEWQYVRLGSNCMATEDTFYITATSRNVRYIDGVNQSGWDLVTSPSGDTSFMFQLADTIFYMKDVSLSLSLPPYKILVGPVEKGTYWSDRSPYTFDYSILEFEDIYSSVAGVTYKGCAKIKRTSADDNKIKYFWWSSEWGKVKEVEYQSAQCLQGEELRYLDKSHAPP